MDAKQGLLGRQVRLKGRLLLAVEELARVGVEDEQVKGQQRVGAAVGRSARRSGGGEGRGARLERARVGGRRSRLEDDGGCKDG